MVSKSLASGWRSRVVSGGLAALAAVGFQGAARAKDVAPRTRREDSNVTFGAAPSTLRVSPFAFPNSVARSARQSPSTGRPRSLKDHQRLFGVALNRLESAWKREARNASTTGEGSLLQTDQELVLLHEHAKALPHASPGELVRSMSWAMHEQRAGLQPSRPGVDAHFQALKTWLLTHPVGKRVA